MYCVYVKGRPSPAAKVTPPPSVTVNNGATSFSQDLITAEVEINDSAARYEKYNRYATLLSDIPWNIL